MQILKKLLKKNSLCGSILQFLFQIFKNQLKCISALTAYVWGATPCSALPTADENAVTESACCDYSIFQPVLGKTAGNVIKCGYTHTGTVALVDHHHGKISSQI